MKLLRTPEERFEKIPDFPFEPHYIEVDEIRIHYVDEGSNDEEVILLMHGEPSWSFLYRLMIPPLVKAGFRVVVPDLVGFGRSDKPTEQSDHTYAKHVDWMTKWMLSIDLKNITLFCQDWGSLIGLRMAIENQARFKRIVLSNGGLPTGATDGLVSDQANENFERFKQWREFSRTTPSLPIKMILQMGTFTKLSRDVLKAYDAPFPDESFKAGARIMPSRVPITPDDPEREANTIAREQFKKWNKPFLTAFGDSDPITSGGDLMWHDLVPGAKGQKHTTIKNASHFVQEDGGPELAEIIINFIKDNP
jgi:haloalkane dehalogenase